MKLKTLHFFLLFLLGSQFSFAQSSFLDHWEIPYNSTISIASSPSGGFLVACATRENQADVIQLIQYDECDNIAFTKKIYVPNHSIRLADLILSSDGFFYLIGHFMVDANNTDFFILKLDAEGDEIFFRVMGNSLKNYCYSIQEMPNGNLMIFGTTYLPGASSGSNYFLILDNQGNVISNKAYFDVLVWGYGTALSDGFLGRMGRLVYKVDLNGNLVWANEYSGIRYSTQALEVADGYVSVSFRSSTTVPDNHFLYKLHKDGSLAWASRGYIGKGHAVIKQMPNGNFLVLDTYPDEVNTEKYHLQAIEYSVDGEQIGHQTLTSICAFAGTIGKDLVVLADGSIVFAASSGMQRDTLKIGRADLNFELDCVENQSIQEVDVTPMTAQPKSTNVVDISFETFEYDLLEITAPPADSRICESNVITFPTAPNDTSICAGDELILDFSMLGATYEWQDGSDAPSYLVTQDGNYEVLIEKCGESVTRTIEVGIEECPCDLKTPNAFTPDGDGLNDNFQVISDCELLDFEIKIFNRWGQIVFQSTDATRGWDGNRNGKNLTSDVYIYFYQYRLSRGFNLEMQSERGDVTLIR